MNLTRDVIATLPKVLLHDHLDGGLRPATIVELAAEAGHSLPTTDPEELGAWFRSAADSGSLERYLETFDHTIAVMQSAAGLRRVAREAAVDLAADGVVYAEQRYAPEQHLAGGLTLQEVVDAVQEGFAEGVAEAAAAGRTIRIGTLLTAMRHADRGLEIAELTIANRDSGVVGFDIAGAEAGFPPARHLAAFQALHRENMPVTIHAGEAAGVESMWEAVQVCGAQRLGHGVRIMDDIAVLDDPVVDEVVGMRIADLGRFAQWVLDRRIVLEVCPVSNLQTGAATSIAEHPITLLRDLDFAVSINTDNRLMSATSMTNEMLLLVAEAGWDIDDLLGATVDAVEASFLPHEDGRQLMLDVILPAYESAGALIATD